MSLDHRGEVSDTAPDTAGSSAITNHCFIPRGEWWTVCEVCAMAEAAHTYTATLCVVCDWPNEPCSNRQCQ